MYTQEKQNTTAVNMQKRGNQKQIYRNETLKMPISRDKASKVKYTELKYGTSQYAETR